MKIKSILLACLLIPVTIYCQKQNQGEEFKIGSYTVKNILNPDKTYGFEIYFENQNKPLLQQKIKPYSIRQKGFMERQNAFVAALWYVGELQAGRNDVNKLTLTKAKELGITQKDLNQ